jgi:hypothetical protein
LSSSNPTAPSRDSQQCYLANDSLASERILSLATFAVLGVFARKLELDFVGFERRGSRKDAKYRKGRKEENYCVYAVLRYSSLESGRDHTLAMPLQRHWCRGNLLIPSETNLFLEAN